ncbi:cytochrome oxidase complex assembly protein 1-domain-containing protein [Scheffersomyces coipomensis]|uniref:cytochrome oxidase complex assembly protein 1-domain-containing protein n=1 Tax=Scheffersomyces coipomensis TaxID=1788519 RepID=UPI00315D115D
MMVTRGVGIRQLNQTVLTRFAGAISPRFIKFNSTSTSTTTNATTTSTNNNSNIINTRLGKRVISVEKDLPDPFIGKKQNRIYFVVYGIGVIVSCVIIFNYEKTGSPILTSTLYYLRRSPKAKQILGEDINYAYNWPWISGPLNVVQGDINISFDIKGNKKVNEEGKDDFQYGVIKLRATRASKLEPFKIHDFKLVVKDEYGNSSEYDLSNDDGLEFGF